MKSFIKRLMALLALLLLLMDFAAAGDGAVRFYFYEGIRPKEKTKPAVAASYFLKPMTGDYMLFRAQSARETARLKKIYNLMDIVPLLHREWTWSPDRPGNLRRQTLVLNGNVFTVQMTLLDDKDAFRLKVNEQKNLKVNTLLDTRFSLPEKNTAIFGFEDSMDRIFFLSFHRSRTGKTTPTTAAHTLALEPGQAPAPYKRVDPVYPPQAVENRKEGMVVMEVTVDVTGGVSHVKVTGGEHPLLNKAAITAVKQWKYKPFKIKGTAKPVTFTVVMDFYFN
jgi:TonB family protein